jgi:hypothetical protein
LAPSHSVIALVFASTALPICILRDVIMDFRKLGPGDCTAYTCLFCFCYPIFLCFCGMILQVFAR